MFGSSDGSFEGGADVDVALATGADDAMFGPGSFAPASRGVISIVTSVRSGGLALPSGDAASFGPPQAAPAKTNNAPIASARLMGTRIRASPANGGKANR